MFPSCRGFVNIRIVFPRIQCDENKFGNKFCDSQQYLEAAMNNLTRNTDSMQKATSQNPAFFELELLKNIDQLIPVILVKVDTYTLHSYVRGYHAYMNIWNPKLGDNDVEVKHEVNTEHDKFAIAIFHGKRIVGQVPKNLSEFFYQFMSLPNCTINCEVTGKRVNRRGGYGLEIPVKYTFLGPNKAIKWIEKRVTEIISEVVMKNEHWLS